jgi:hypothetical protein
MQFDKTNSKFLLKLLRYPGGLRCQNPELENKERIASDFDLLHDDIKDLIV